MPTRRYPAAMRKVGEHINEAVIKAQELGLKRAEIAEMYNRAITESKGDLRKAKAITQEYLKRAKAFAPGKPKRLGERPKRKRKAAAKAQGIKPLKQRDLDDILGI